MVDQGKEFNRSLRLLAGSSLVVFLGIALSKIFTYGYNILIARYYGAAAFGIFSLAVMVSGWFLVVAKLGLPQGLVRYIPLYRGKDESKRIGHLFHVVFWSVFGLSLVMGLILYLLSEKIAIGIFDSEELVVFLKIFSVFIPVGSLSAIFLSSMRAYERVGWQSFNSRILDTGIKFLVLGLLISFGFSLVAVPISYLFGSLIVLLVSYVFCVRNLKGLHVNDLDRSKSNMGELFSYSWPLMFFGISAMVLHWTDTFLIGLFRTSAEVGYYNAAMPIAFLVTIFTDLFRQLFFPLVTKEYGKGNGEVVKQLSKQVGKWNFMLSWPLVVLILLFSGEFIILLFGQEFFVGANALRFLVLGAMFVSVFEVSKDLLSMKGKSKMILGDLLFVAGVNLVLNIILVPKYGIDGAGFSTMVSFVLLNCIFAVQGKKEVGVLPVRKKMIGIFISGILAGVIVFVLSEIIGKGIIEALVLSAIFILIYCFFIWIFRCFDENDKGILRALKRKVYN